jgi:uncharacterized protein DUF2510
MPTPRAAAGWYPDPSHSGRLRYFDGTDWTEYYADQLPAQPSARTRQPRQGPLYRPVFWVIILALAVSVPTVIYAVWYEHSTPGAPIGGTSNGTSRPAMRVAGGVGKLI